MLFCLLLAFGLHEPKFFPANDAHIQYMGRVDLSVPRAPRFWSPGVVVRWRFAGRSCRVVLRDQVLGGNDHNYIEIAVEGELPLRLKLSGADTTLTIRAATDGEHVVSLCKDTESGIGWLECRGVYAEALLTPPALPERKIECIGNSITAGTGMDLSVIPCGKGEWYDQHNAWMSYGAQTARMLNAQWHLTAVAGIGLIHSCCKMDIVMPQVFDKMDLRDDSGSWDFRRYIPDVVTVCLGQNDGIQDSTVFCNAYVRFIGDIRRRYPAAQIVCLTSPMGDKTLTDAQKRYLTGIVGALRSSGDLRVSSYFFSRQFSHGCGGHPDLQEHGVIAAELAGYLRKIMGWEPHSL